MMSFCFFAPAALASPMRLPDEVAFSMGGLSVYWYGILLAAALLTALLLLYVESKRKGLGPDLATDLCLVAIPSGVVGARLFYVITFYNAFRANPLSMLAIWDGGLSVYGAALFALLGVLIYTLCKKIPLLQLLDAATPALALSNGIAVWGDFFNQQGYGPLVTQPALQWFPFAVLIEKTDTIHYAAFFYEFVFCLALFLFLWLYLRKKARRDGTVFFTFLLLFALCHGLTESLRVDSLYLYGELKIAQAVCVALFLLSAVALVVLSRRPLPVDPAELDQADAEAAGQAAPTEIVEEANAPSPEPQAEEIQTDEPTGSLSDEQKNSEEIKHA